MTSLQPGPAAVTMKDPEGTRFSGLLTAAILLLPAFFAAWLIKRNTVDVPNWDDFTFLEDWLSYRVGTLTWSDIFRVHLEHRVAVPRMLALVAHLIGGKDLRWQNCLTVFLLLGAYWNLVVIWRRTAETTARRAWLPLLLMSSTLFCAVQWQPLLWPILFEIFIGLYCITLALRLWAGRMNPWLALFCSLPLCAISMLSFANGMLTWLIIPFAIWLQRPGLGKGLRWKLIGVWLACLAVTLYFYFRNFHNTAPPQFAYNFGEEMSAKDTVSSSLAKVLDLKKLPVAVQFALALLGSHLCRGLNLPNFQTAQFLGGLSILLWLFALAWLVRPSAGPELRRRAAPWLLLGMFSIGTACLITLGRVGLTRSGVNALLPRYVSHAVPLTVSLIALAWIIGQSRVANRPSLRAAGAVVGGGLLMLLGMEWIYGARIMDQWHNARLQSRAMLLFTKLLPDGKFLGPISGNGYYGAKIMLALDRIGQSPVPLLENLRLDQFHVSTLTLRHRQAGFNELHDTADGGLFAVGYSELPNQRPADLVIFSTPDETGAEKIFALDYPLRLPNFLHVSTIKDHEYLYMDDVDPGLYARWEGNLTLMSKPARTAPVNAWALDVERNFVYRIPDNRTSQEPLPPLPHERQED